MQVFLPLLFVLHVADSRREVPEADVGVLRLQEHNGDKKGEELAAMVKLKQGITQVDPRNYVFLGSIEFRNVLVFK